MKRATDKNIVIEVKKLVTKRDHRSALMKNKDCLISLERYLHSNDYDVVLMTIEVFDLCAMEPGNRSILYNIPKLISTLSDLSTQHKCAQIREKSSKLLDEIDRGENELSSSTDTEDWKIEPPKMIRYVSSQPHIIKLRVSNISNVLERERFLSDATQLSVVVSATMGTDLKQATLFCTTGENAEVVSMLRRKGYRVFDKKDEQAAFRCEQPMRDLVISSPIVATRRTSKCEPQTRSSVSSSTLEPMERKDSIFTRAISLFL